MRPPNNVVTVAVALFQSNEHTPAFSRALYSPVWVDKLYRGIRRNYTGEFRMVCHADDVYNFKTPIELVGLKDRNWQTACQSLYNTPAPSLLVTMGLDTVIVGNLDELFGYEGRLAVPRDPYNSTQPCNGVVLLDGPRPDLAEKAGVTDMTALVGEDYDYIDDLFPGQCESFKVHVAPNGCVKKNQRIVYFHGEPKPHQVDVEWIKSSWI